MKAERCCNIFPRANYWIKSWKI